MHSKNGACFFSNDRIFFTFWKELGKYVMSLSILRENALGILVVFSFHAKGFTEVHLMYGNITLTKMLFKLAVMGFSFNRVQSPKVCRKARGITTPESLNDPVETRTVAGTRTREFVKQRKANWGIIKKSIHRCPSLTCNAWNMIIIMIFIFDLSVFLSGKIITSSSCIKKMVEISSEMFKTFWQINNLMYVQQLIFFCSIIPCENFLAEGPVCMFVTFNPSEMSARGEAKHWENPQMYPQ